MKRCVPERDGGRDEHIVGANEGSRPRVHELNDKLEEIIAEHVANAKVERALERHVAIGDAELHGERLDDHHKLNANIDEDHQLNSNVDALISASNSEQDA